MASKTVEIDSEIGVKRDEIKAGISDNVELGQVELFPWREEATAILFENGLVFKLVDSVQARRSKRFVFNRERSNSEKLQNDFDGIEVGPQKCIIVKWEDFLNCRIVQLDKAQKSNHLEIISYEVCALTKKMKYKQRIRFLLRFSPLPSPNKEDLQHLWVNKIILASRKYVQREFKTVGILSDEELLAKKRVLVLLNPVSGKGIALKTFRQQISSFLTEAGIDFELFVSQRAGHVREMLHEEQLDKWDALLFVSGDGLLNEGINGLLSREDASIAIQKPIGILPCGSGNAIASLILHYSHEDYSPLNAAFVFAKGLYNSFQSLDLGACIQGDSKNYFSLAIGWGLIGDIDIETEVIRKVGESRFILGALWRILKRRVYQADLSYLPFDEPKESNISANENISNSTEPSIQVLDEISPINQDGVIPDHTDSMESWVKFPGPFTTISLSLSPLISHGLFIAPDHVLGQGFFTLVILPYENISRWNLVQLLNNMEEENVSGSNGVIYKKVKGFRISPTFPENGYLTVDGELLHYRECIAEMSNYKMSVPTLFDKDRI